MSRGQSYGIMPARFLLIIRSVCILVAGALLPQAASAHATPIQYFPAASSVLAVAPTEVQIRFSERIEPRASSIIVLAQDGSRVDLANVSVDPADPRVLRVGLKSDAGGGAAPSGSGTYTVSWQVTSADDGHFTKGGYVFSVGTVQPTAAAEQGGTQIVHSSSVPEALTLALEVIGDALVFGALLVLVFVWRPARRRFPELSADETRAAHSLRALVVAGCCLALTGGVAYLLYKANELAGLEGTSFGASWTSFLATTSARFTVYRMIGMGLVLLGWFARERALLAAQRITTTDGALFLLLALIDLDRARISHAAASNFAPAFGVLMNFVHLLFKEAWIGGLVVLVALLSPLIGRWRDARIAAFVFTTFAKIASVSLGVAGVTGAYIVWLHLKSVSYVLTTDWGKRFVVLSVFALFLLALRLFHQLYCDPALVNSIRSQDARQQSRVFWWLSFTLPAETAVGVAILAVTSLLIITTPPLVPHYSFLRSSENQGMTVSLEQHPYERGKLLVVAQGAKENPADITKMVVTLANRAAGIGPIAAPLEQRFTGGYVFDQKLLTPPGTWTIDVTAQRAGAYDASASFDVNYPGDIAESDAHTQDRSFGWFGAANVGVALLALAASLVLYWRSSALNRMVLSLPEATIANPPATLVRPIAWIPASLAIGAVLYLAGGIPVLSAGALEGPFQRACEDANVLNMWHENVPERDGNATADFAVPGCTIGMGLGQYHLADPREFAYFERAARARAQLAVSPEPLVAGVPTMLTFTLRDYQGRPIEDLVLDHNRIMHVVIASKDFSVFSHIHAEDLGPITPEMRAASTFAVRYTFPRDGRYLVSVDFTERAYIFSDQFYLDVGSSGAMGNPSSENLSRTEKVDGYDVTLRTSPGTLTAGMPATLDYHIERAGRPVTDLNPYLAVPMHISIIRSDLMGFLHVHGLLPVSATGKMLGESIHASHLFLPNQFGPDIEATNFAFPSPGTYHVFGEFSAAGKVVVTQFVVRVE
jgi:methionine-rich copper-binding protein CopC/putative copper export protein